MDNNTLIGDLLHHRGQLIDLRLREDGTWEEARVEFKGYADLVANWAALGISATENPDGSLSLTSGDAEAWRHDLWPLSTNLLNSGTGGAGPGRPGLAGCALGADLKKGFKIGNPDAVSAGGLAGVGPVTEFQVPYQRSYFSDVGPVDDYGNVSFDNFTSMDVVLNQRLLDLAMAFTFGRPFPIHRMTVGQVLTLDHLGDPAVPGQDTAHGKYTTRQLILTPFGLVLKCQLEVALDWPMLTTSPQNEFPTDLDWFAVSEWDFLQPSLDQTGTKLICPLAFRFTGYGWASESAPAFLSPRKPRVLAQPVKEAVRIWNVAEGKVQDLGQWPRHPNFLSGALASGDDYQIQSLSGEQMDRETTKAAILTPLPAPTRESLPFAGEVPMVRPPDNIADFLQARSTYGDREDALLGGAQGEGIVRVNGLREHYNCIANYVNSLKKAWPYTLSTHRFLGAANQTFFVQPDAVGPFGDRAPGVRPRHHFAVVTPGTDLWNWAVANGVPIKGEADLPPSWNRLKRTRGLSRTVRRQVDLLITYASRVSQNPPLPGSVAGWRYTVHHRYTASGLSDVRGSDAAFLSETFDPGTLAEYHWITIEDVQAAAERAAFKFLFQRVTVPLALRSFVIGPASLLWENANPLEFDVLWDQNVLPVDPPVGSTWTTSYPVEIGYDAAQARFVEARNDAEAEWVRDPGSPTYLVDHKAGDFLTLAQGQMVKFAINDSPPKGMMAVYRLEAEADYLRDLPDLNFWKDPSLRGGTANIGFGMGALLVQCFGSAGLSPEPRLVLIPSDSFEHDGDAYSATGLAQAMARQGYGVRVLPLKTVAALPGAQEIPISGKETFVDGRDRADAAKVLFVGRWGLGWE